MNSITKDNSALFSYSKDNFINPAIVTHLLGTIHDSEELLNIFKAINIVPRDYNLRINLSKITPEEVLKYAKDLFPAIQFKLGFLSNVLKIPISKATIGELQTKIVYCDKFAAESIMLGADLFVPGIKGFNGKFPMGEPVSIVLSPNKYPEIVKISNYSSEELTHKFHVANGEAMISSRDFPKHLKGIFVKNTEAKYSIPPYRNSDLYEKGYITEQNLPPNLAVAIFMDKFMEVFPEGDGLILDTCSAPGHKTSAMAEWGYANTQALGEAKWPKILSIDRSTNRLEHLRRDIIRLDLQNIEVLACNLRKLLSKRPELEQSADFLMFDPPCSALGTRPKIFLDKTTKELMDYPVNQRRLLKIVDDLVKPGGYLMYNTCTIPKEENEDIIAYAVQKLGYQVVPIKEKYRKMGHPGLPQLDLPKTDTDRLIRFYPTLEAGIGYFIAFLQKKVN